MGVIVAHKTLTLVEGEHNPYRVFLIQKKEVIMAYNIRQVNNYMIKGGKLRTPPKQFEVPGTDTVIPQYLSAVSDDVIKFSYCCEPSGHIYPIFIKVRGTYRMIFPDKYGIYNMQPEEITLEENVSSEDSQKTNTTITEILVPNGVDFTLDYATVSI